jgi:hypothetical protein
MTDCTDLDHDHDERIARVVDKAAAEDHSGGNEFHDLDGAALWIQMAAHCRRCTDQLREYEQGFIRNVSSKIVWRQPNEREAKWLRRIVLRTGGRL